jgi:Fe2+ transport system protein B
MLRFPVSILHNANLPDGRFTTIEEIIPGWRNQYLVLRSAFCLFISLIRESGYMSRVVLMDKIMRKYGLSGKVLL